MKFRIDGLGDDSAYVEVEQKENWLEIGVGYPSSQKRAFVSGMNRRQALALAGMLKALATTLG